MSFQQHIRRTVPQINPNYWSFAITGKVRHPLILSFADLQTFPTQMFRSALTCSATNTTRSLISEAEWRGVSLPALLERVSINPEARYAHIHAADGFTTVLTLDTLAQTVLAYEMNGAPLLPEYGFPARLIAPGLHGYKMPKWINRIELRVTAEGGFWESRGWSLDGKARTEARILSYERAADGSIELAGVAYAGTAEIALIQISIDGAGGMSIPFTPAAPFTLTRWRIHWTPPGVGDYAASVRAYAVGQLTPVDHTVIVKVR